MNIADYGVLSPAWAGGSSEFLASDEAFVACMLEVEARWVLAQAQAGLCTQADADAVAEVADPARYDLGELARKTPDGANALIPLLGMMRRLLAEDRAPASAATALHRGATSQDIIDSALMLMIRRAVNHLLDSLQATADGLATLASEHRTQVCIARSLTQHALPTTFGYKAASWLQGIMDAAGRLHDIRDELPLQFGGAVGTHASLEQFLSTWPEAPSVQQLTSALAEHVGLKAPLTPWHTNRQPVLQIGTALASAVAALGTFGADVLNASRPEIGEVTEPREAGKGGSSAMPQKQNPVHSVLLKSAALQAPGLVSTLFVAAGAAVDERPEGSWHAEWPTLRELLRLALGAGEHAAILARGMRVNTDALERNLRLGGDAVLSERLATVLAGRIEGGKATIQALVLRSLTESLDLRELLRGELSTEVLGDAELDELLDPAGYLGSAPRFTDMVLADYSARKELWQSHS